MKRYGLVGLVALALACGDDDTQVINGQGNNGTNGTNGANGQNGTNGTNGVQIDPELANRAGAAFCDVLDSCSQFPIPGCAEANAEAYDLLLSCETISAEAVALLEECVEGLGSVSCEDFIEGAEPRACFEFQAAAVEDGCSTESTECSRTSTSDGTTCEFEEVCSDGTSILIECTDDGASTTCLCTREDQSSNEVQLDLTACGGELPLGEIREACGL